jgi:cysteine desulfurase
MFGGAPMLYFDHNATHPLSRAAREAWLEATERYIGNPSSPHRLGARAETALGQAREKLAAWLDCDPHDIVWTSGATEANNTAIHSAAANGAKDIWISAIEHPCTLAATERYFGKGRQSIPVTRDGVTDVAWLAEALKISTPGLVAVMAANNETGVLQPWREVLERCREHGVPFFCDAAQWIGKLPAQGLGACDFVSGCAHKFGGPQGVGFLKVPARFRSLIVGGPQEEGRRAGTENVAGVLAMMAALEEREATGHTSGKTRIAEKTLEGRGGGVEAGRLVDVPSRSVSERVQWRDDFSRELEAALPGVKIVGGGADRLWNTVAAIMPEVADCRQRWVVKLDKLGYAVSTGSACASGKEETSHVLTAMGIGGDQASRALRFSSGWETTHEDWTRLLDGLRNAHRELAG